MGSEIPETSASWNASIPRAGDVGLPGDDDHRHGVHAGREDARDGVRGPGPRGDQDDRRLSRGARVPVRHVRGALLVANQHELDGGIHQGVEQRDGGPAGQAEDVLHSLLLQNLHHALGAGASSSASLRLPWLRLGF